MPRLLVFAVCERVLVDEESKSSSLIGLLDGVNPQIPPDFELPLDAQVPMFWAIVALWRSEPGDEKLKFRQITEILRPDGVSAVDSVVMDFEFNTTNHRNLVRANSFPVGLEGLVTVNVRLQQLGPDGNWVELPSQARPYPLTVRHIKAEPSPPSALDTSAAFPLTP